MRFMDCISVVVLMLCIDEGIGQDGLRFWFTKEFLELMISMQRTYVGSKIVRKVYGRNEFSTFGHDFEKCPERLLHIISDKVKCDVVARKLEPQLLRAQIYYSMLEDEKLWESILVSRNCSQLSGSSLALCEKVFSGTKMAHQIQSQNRIGVHINEEINNCFSEEKGNLINYMTKR